jgi:tRNA-Thr(GGU) m(6)t(6)A37 methyltransferase TsaA
MAEKLLKEIIYHPIGIIHSPFKEPSQSPIQPSAGRGSMGEVEIYPQYRDALQDIDQFSHIILLYHFHSSKKFSLLVKPYLDDQLRGLFATRAPARPNAIGMSVVRLLSVENLIISIADLDMIDRTPLLDIKPYVPEFDKDEKIKIGWLEEKIKNLPGKKGNNRLF